MDVFMCRGGDTVTPLIAASQPHTNGWTNRPSQTQMALCVRVQCVPGSLCPPAAPCLHLTPPHLACLLKVLSAHRHVLVLHHDKDEEGGGVLQKTSSSNSYIHPTKPYLGLMLGKPSTCNTCYEAAARVPNPSLQDAPR